MPCESCCRISAPEEPIPRGRRAAFWQGNWEAESNAVGIIFQAGM